VIEGLRRKFGDFFLVPEGGSNAAAVRGAAEIAAELTVDYDVVCCPCGTGGTLAGLAAGLPPGKHAIGFAALKGAGFLNDDARRLQAEYGHETDNWTIELDYHFGGFARRTRVLDDFIEEFRRRHGVELEWVYVAKMLYGVFEMVERRRFEPGATVVAVITGPAMS
jgi:1-aminocyclopropane-1-carboxylate deaminase